MTITIPRSCIVAVGILLAIMAAIWLGPVVGLPDNVVIGLACSLALNGSMFVGSFQVMRLDKVDCRIAGFGGTTAAFGIWTWYHKASSAEEAFVSWLIVCILTVAPNYLIHKNKAGKHEAEILNQYGRE